MEAWLNRKFFIVSTQQNYGILLIFIHLIQLVFIKNIAQKIGKYNLDFKYSADRDLFYRMIKIHKMVGKATKEKKYLEDSIYMVIHQKSPFLKSD